MKEKSIFKKRLILLLIILLIVLMVNLIKYNLEGNDGYIQKVDIPVVQESSMSIINDRQEEIEVGDLDIVVLYNTVLVPINDTFKAIFSDYVEDVNQTLNSSSMELNIDFDNNTIIIPSYYLLYGSQKIDNTVIVEIEEYKDKKYIPLYLISNLNNITVKLDGIEIYKNINYISSIDVIKNKNEDHTIQIFLNMQNESKNETYLGQAQGSLWREEALKRIEKYRKEDVNIIIKNQNNKVISNVNTNIGMINNDFKFGTAIRYNGRQNDFTEINRKIFNILGSEGAFKWKALGKNKVNEIIDFSKNNNMELRGHCLWWDYIFSNTLKDEIIGDRNSLKEGTMAYVYEKFSKGEITQSQADELTIQIKQNFESIVLNHIKQEINDYPDVNEWDVVNELLTQKYFKFYLYDKNYLISEEFLNNDKKEYSSGYIDNESYYRFIAKCFDVARQTNLNLKLVLNDNLINGNYVNTIAKENLNLIKNVLKYTNNIDTIGVQYHVSNNYSYNFPQSYYNCINFFLKETGIKEVVVTEYDNYKSNKIGNYTEEEKKTKADYLRDSLIMAYSNTNISQFTMWVYNCDHFEDEERQAYEELVTPWLNYKEYGTSGDSGYNTRLYKGEYSVNVKLSNGKEQTVNLKVSDGLSNSVEIVFVANATGMDLDKLPDNLTVYRGYDLDLTGGLLNVFYDDGTVEEIPMNDSRVKITGYDKNYVGKQTITATVEGYSISFDVNVLENISNIVTKIKQDNNVIKNIDSSIYSNTNVDNKYQAFIKLLDNMVVKSKNVNLTTVEKVFDAQFNILNTIIEEYNAGRITISNFTLNQLFFAYINVVDDYKLLYSYYVLTDELEFSDVVQKSLNGLIDKYNDNLDIESIVFLKDIITVEKDIYNNKLQLDSKSDNYLNKQGILKIVNSLSNIIDNKIELFKKEEKSKLKIVSDTDMSITTNKDVTITLLHGDNTTIINNDGKDTYTFTENGKFIFKVAIKNEIYALLVTVDNIDKTRVDVGNTSEYMLDGNYIINIEKNTKVKTLVQNLIINSDHSVLRNGNNVKDVESNVATGDVLQVGNRTYTLVVTGDVNSDGNCDLKDLIILRKYLLGEIELTKVQLKASDIVKDESIDLKDLLQFRKEILK